MTSPATGWLSGGPWRHGVAVTSIGGRPAASSLVVSQAFRPGRRAAEPLAAPGPS